MSTTRLRFRRGTTAQWATANPVLAEGEPGFDVTLDIFKIGNGVDHWSDLQPLTEAAPSGTSVPVDAAFDGVPDGQGNGVTDEVVFTRSWTVDYGGDYVETYTTTMFADGRTVFDFENSGEAGIIYRKHVSPHFQGIMSEALVNGERVEGDFVTTVHLSPSGFAATLAEVTAGGGSAPLKRLNLGPAGISILGLPTVQPSSYDTVWNDGGTLKITDP